MERKGIYLHKNNCPCSFCKAKRGEPLSEEIKKKISENNPKYWLGKHLSEEAKQKNREGHLGNIPWNKNKMDCFSEETIAKISLSLTGEKNPNFGKHWSEETKRKIGLGNKGKIISEEQRKKLSAAQSSLWQDENYAKRMIQNFHMKPNGAELYLNSILQNNFPDEWWFVGDGQVILDGLCPDFINVSPSEPSDSKKKIIELFGEHCHMDGGIFAGKKVSYRRTEQGRKEAFVKFGYSTLIIWESELADEKKVIEKIKNFL